MTSLTVITPVLGTTVGNEADNDIITTQEHVAADASGTTVTIDTGTTIDYPVGEDQEISIVTPIDPATEAQIPENVDGIAAIRTFGPTGTNFNPAITVTITYTDAEVAGMDESLLGVYLYNETTEIYDTQVPAEDIVSRDEANNTITFTLDHFSTYARGVATADTVAPVVTLNGAASITIECGDTYSELGATATDDRDGTLPVQIDSSSVDTSALGTYTVTYTAQDAGGNSTTATRLISVVDTVAPQATVTVIPDTLWPPNHKLIVVTPTVTATDACDTENTYDELFDNAIEDGDTTGDVQIDGSGQILLRAERKGKNNGRTYTLNYTITDASGNTTTASATVTVPHNQ